MQRQVVEKDMKRLSLSHLTFWISPPPKIRPVFRGNTVNYHMFNRAGIEFAYLCVMCNFWNEHALQCTSDWNRIQLSSAKSRNASAFDTDPLVQCYVHVLKRMGMS